MKVGEKIKELRKEKGFTQAAFADLIDVSPQLLSLWENGGLKPRLANLQKIVRAFDLSLSVFDDCY